MKMIKSFLCVLLWMPLAAFAQKSATANAVATFTVNAPALDVCGTNRYTVIGIDFRTGEVKARILVDSFAFYNNFSSQERNSIITERFRMYYMESKLYPDVVFLGKITNLDSLQLKTDGSYLLNISGYLIMHGVKRRLSIEAELTVNGVRKSVVSDFVIDPEDFEIRLPHPIFIGGTRDYFKRVNIKITADL